LIAAHFARMSLADHPSEDAMMALALAFAREQNPS
jgi:uroporphyrinogen-III synthase